MRALSIVVALSACDPVHNSAVDALGPEAPGVPHGPNHRPGQPCLQCHDGALGDARAFSVAGTVFQRPSDREPVSEARVDLTGADGAMYTARTNGVGNFYVMPEQFSPRYPMRVVVTTQAEVTVTMKTLIGREGSCAGCHSDPASASSPGHICVELDDGGAPP